MLLFLDRIPFYWWMPDQEPGARKFWSVSVPALATEAESFPPSMPTRPHRWRIDTGCSGDTFLWKHHLLEAGLSPSRNIVRRSQAVFGAGSVREDLLIRTGAVWLFSNIPALRTEPFRLGLDPGITFVDRNYHGDPRFATPVIGMQALRRAGAKVELDFANDTVSVWVPSTWRHRLSVTIRRWLSGGRTTPIVWRD